MTFWGSRTGKKVLNWMCFYLCILESSSVNCWLGKCVFNRTVRYFTAQEHCRRSCSRFYQNKAMPNQSVRKIQSNCCFWASAVVWRNFCRAPLLHALLMNFHLSSTAGSLLSSVSGGATPRTRYQSRLSSVNNLWNRTCCPQSSLQQSDYGWSPATSLIWVAGCSVLATLADIWYHTKRIHKQVS